MKSLVLIAILMSTAACSQMKSDYSVAPEAKPYLDGFLSEASKRGSNPAVKSFADSWVFSISFNDLKTYTLGYCRKAKGKVAKSPFEFVKEEKREIVLDRKYWSMMTDVNKMEVVYHELAHCTMGRGHLNDNTTFTLNNNTYSSPASLMNAYSISMGRETQVVEFMDYYLDEMFGVASLASRVKTDYGMVASKTTNSSRMPANVDLSEDHHDDCVVENSIDENGHDLEVTTCTIKTNTPK